MPKPTQSIDALLEEYISKLEQRYSAQNQQLTTLINNVASCIVLLDAHQRPTFMNPAARTVTGHRLHTIQRRSIHRTFHRCPGPDNCPINQAIRQLQPITAEEDQFLNHRGELFPVLYSVIPLHQDGLLSGVILEFQDITHLKQLEQQKDDFIAIASHELKTPVTSIQNYTQTLERRFKKRGEAESAALLEKVNLQLQRLTSLITDLLDVTKLEGGKLPIHPCLTDFDELVQEAVESLQLNKTASHQIRIHGRIGRPLCLDSERLRQVLINLLSNAIKYSPGAETVEVDLTVERDRAITSVRDFGIGITTDQQAQVFDRFYRVSDDDRETFSGLGLGLYISAEIVRQHGGEISVRSQKGQGSTFSFWLPVAENC